jgi:hypothetical protein
MAAVNFQSRLESFLKYWKLTRNLDRRFPDASEEEILGAGECLICHDSLEIGANNPKVLPCNHVYHLNCLRTWFQHRQTCPLCRTDIPIQQNLARNLALAAAAVVDPPRAPGEEAATDDENEHPNTHISEMMGTEEEQDHDVQGMEGNSDEERNLNLDEFTQVTHVVQGSDGFTDVVREGGGTLLPAFFSIQTPLGISIHSEPTESSSVVRQVKYKSLVFVTGEKIIERSGGTMMWFQVPDGWIAKKSSLSGESIVEEFLGHEPSVRARNSRKPRSCESVSPMNVRSTMETSKYMRQIICLRAQMAAIKESMSQMESVLCALEEQRYFPIKDCDAKVDPRESPCSTGGTRARQTVEVKGGEIPVKSVEEESPKSKIDRKSESSDCTSADVKPLSAREAMALHRARYFLKSEGTSEEKGENDMNG